MSSPLISAPFGYLFTGLPSESIEQTRDDMVMRFETHKPSLRDNKAYYESMRRPDAIGLAVPKEMQKLLSHVGYPRIYVDAISERLELEGFRLGGDDDADNDLWDWWQANDLDIESPLGHSDALVHGRSYITIGAPDPELDSDWDQSVPIIRVEAPTDLYAVIDHRTRCVLQAVRVVYELDQHLPTSVTLYLPNRTVAWSRVDDWQVYQDVNHDLGVVPVVPITNRISMSDLYGTSQITPEIRAVTDAAARILMDMQGAAELMAIPQRLLFGVNPSDIGIDPATGASSYNATLAKILAFADPEGKAFQFAAAELRNFGDALDQLDRKAAAYTGLPPQYLSVTSDNPASAEAITAAESRFVKTCERKNLLFGGAWEKAMRIAYAVMNDGGIGALPSKYNRMEAIWRNPATPTYASVMDAATKGYAGGTGFIPKERARIDAGYTIVEREDMKKWDEEEMAGLLGAYATGPGSVVAAPVSAPAAPAVVPAKSPAPVK